MPVCVKMRPRTFPFQKIYRDIKSYNTPNLCAEGIACRTQRSTARGASVFRPPRR